MIAALRRLRPIDGWRRFLGEVGIIVLGVLIALVIGQAAQAWQDRQNARSARESIDREIVDNLSRIRERQRIQPCIDRRMDQIQAVIIRALAGDGDLTQAKWVGRPQYWTLSRTRLAAATQAGRTSLMTLEDQESYAYFDSLFDEFGEAERQEQNAWGRLRAIEVLPRLAPLDAASLLQALQDARNYNWRVRINVMEIVQTAAQRGLKARHEPYTGSLSVCLPITMSRAQALARMGPDYPEP